MVTVKILYITIKTTGQLLFLGWLPEDEIQDMIDHYERQYPALLNVEIKEVNES
jgi:hypothetical protein